MNDSTSPARRGWFVRRAALTGAICLLVSLVVTVAGDIAPASADTFTTTGVSGTFQLNDITCVSATTCVAVGSSSGQNSAAVEIVNGTAGTVAVSPDTNSGRLDRVVCVSDTSCLASGVGDNSEGEVISITLGEQASLGTPQYVADTFELFGLACSTTSDCVAVGATSFAGDEGAVVDIVNGTAQSAQDVSSARQFLAVGCTSSTTCIATGSYASAYDDVITNGAPGTAKQTSADLFVADMACSSASCTAVGSDENNSGVGAYVSISPTGTAGTVEDVVGAGGFHGVQCPNSICVAVGEGTISGNEAGEIVAFTPGSSAGSPIDDQDASGFSGVYCTSALSCVLSGDGTGSTANEGVEATASLTAPTATVTGTVSIAQDGNTTPVQGSPLQICAADGGFCASGVTSAADGSYSFTIPAGDTYVVTAFSPAADAYTAGISAPVDAATAGDTYSDADATLTPGPGLASGVSVNGFGGEQNSGTAVPTVNWGSAFGVTLAPAVFQTPAGYTSTLLTLAITGRNTQTGNVETRTVYAGGEITVNGQSAAVGLPVDPTDGVTVTVPALTPIHGPVSLAISYSNSPNPATGVTAAPAPLVLTNGNPTESVTVAATDFGVDHTVGTPTLTGTDSSSFSIGSPHCAGANLVQNSGGTSPNQSCGIPVTWHPPTTASKNTYGATINIPVTNSSGQSGVLQDQLFACDSRIQGNSQCSTPPPAPPTSPTPIGGPTGQPIGGIYVDPSGTVETPVAGGGTAPVSGATVTLLMEDPATSTYSAVPSGSDVMSPDNRTNPDTTAADGAFGWDTIAGTYEITAAESGCTNSPQTTDPITVPPPATGIVITLDCTAVQTPTTTGLSASPAAPVTGDTVTLTASVTGLSPSGTVDFKDGTTDLGSANVDSSTGEATLAVGTLRPGSHALTASYSGDASNGASNDDTSLDVTTPAKVATGTTATASPKSSGKGQAVSYGATVSPQSGSAEPSGTVSFSVGSTHLCTAALSSTGPDSPPKATCSSSVTPVGSSNVVTASYSGDSAFTTSSGTATESVTLPALSIKTSKLAAAAKGEPYKVTLSHAGGGGSYTWRLASGKLPPGLKLSSAGKLAGKPTKAGRYSFVVKVSDSDAQTATKKLSVRIAEIAVKTSNLKNANKSAHYSVKLTAYGGSGKLVWSHRGQLPKGLTLSKAGILSGKPAKTGTFNFVVTVRDHTRATASKRLKLVVRK